MCLGIEESFSLQLLYETVQKIDKHKDGTGAIDTKTDLFLRMTSLPDLTATADCLRNQLAKRLL